MGGAYLVAKEMGDPQAAINMWKIAEKYSAAR